MEKNIFGRFPCGKEVNIYTLKSEVASLNIIEYGARIQSFTVYGKEIVGGFDTLSDYLSDTAHHGATIGRVANRIEDAKFVMDGKEYTVTANDNGNCLHGGVGFGFKMWELCDAGDDFVSLKYLAADGEEGFPANLAVTVTFTLKDATVIIDYKATPDGKTPIALTNHSYFNLDGFGGTVFEHSAVIYADNYTEVSERLIPTGNRPCVRGTALDFKEEHKIGERIGGDFIGYDHNYIITPTIYEDFQGKSLGLGATVTNGDLKLSVYTDQPGIQLYTGNFLGTDADTPKFRGSIEPIMHGAFCLEAQTEPNCVNSGIGFYNEGEVYTQTTAYKVEKVQ